MAKPLRLPSVNLPSRPNSTAPQGPKDSSPRLRRVWAGSGRSRWRHPVVFGAGTFSFSGQMPDLVALAGEDNVEFMLERFGRERGGHLREQIHIPDQDILGGVLLQDTALFLELGLDGRFHDDLVPEIHFQNR